MEAKGLLWTLRHPLIQFGVSRWKPPHVLSATESATMKSRSDLGALGTLEAGLSVIESIVTRKFEHGRTACLYS